MKWVFRQKEKESFVDLLGDNLSQILLLVEKMKFDAFKSKDGKSIEYLTVISSLISKLCDDRLEFAKNLIVLKN